MHPKLASTKDGKLSLDIHFFKYSKQSKDLLQLRGGSPDLKFFLEAWKEKLAQFKHRPMKHPVIVLIDNDDGATQIFKLLQGKKFGVTIGHATDLPFYHLGGHLYLVKTPIKGPDNKSCPEDFFDPALLATKIDGKTFNPDKEHDAPGEFGKVVFAERVVRPHAGTIDFSGFDPLLARIDAVLDDYAKRTATGPAPALSPAVPAVAAPKKKGARATAAVASP
jgi:RNA-directed DNA polymerase